MRCCFVIGWALPLLFVATARAVIRPSFQMESAALGATDIVVAVPTPGSDTLTVVETWKGTLAVGAGILVKDLPAVPTVTQDGFNPGSPQVVIDGKRVVLFLVRAEGDGAVAGEYVGASWGGTQGSIAYVEGGQVYVYQQVFNPGPSTPMAYGKSEKEFREEAQPLLAAQEALEKAVHLADAGARAKALAAVLAGPAGGALRTRVVEALGNCGPAALPVLRPLLHDGQQPPPGLVEAVVAAARTEGGKELAAILHEEAAFWAKRGPELQAGWWNQLEPAAEREALRGRYTVLSQALSCFEKRPVLAAGADLAQLYQVWSTVPALNDASGLGQMTEMLKKVVENRALVPEHGMGSGPGAGR